MARKYHHCSALSRRDRSACLLRTPRVHPLLDVLADSGFKLNSPGILSRPECIATDDAV